MEVSKKVFLVIIGVVVLVLITIVFSSSSYVDVYAESKKEEPEIDFNQRCREMAGIPRTIGGKEKCFCRSAKNFFNPYTSFCPFFDEEYSVLTARYAQCVRNSLVNFYGCLDIERGSAQRCEGSYLSDVFLCRDSVMRTKCPVQQNYPLDIPPSSLICSVHFRSGFNFVLARARICIRHAENSLEEDECDLIFIQRLEEVYQEFAECYAKEYNIPAV